MSLLLEIRHAGEQNWTVVGRLRNGQPPGSLSNNTESGRDVIQFRCLEHGAVIERSLAGVDEERGATRVITTAGTETLAALADGEHYELELRTDRMPVPVPFRFRYESNGAGRFGGYDYPERVTPEVRVDAAKLLRAVFADEPEQPERPLMDVALDVAGVDSL